MVNDAYQLAPWADVLYASDGKWWKWHQDVPDDAMPALKYTVSPRAIAHRASLQLLRWNGTAGLSTDPSCVRLGGHGGYQAINLAFLLGAAQILLLGYDMQPTPEGRHHFHGEHPDGTHVSYAYRIGTFKSLQMALREEQVSLINASRATAIPASIIPKQPLEACLDRAAGVSTRSD